MCTTEARTGSDLPAAVCSVGLLSPKGSWWVCTVLPLWLWGYSVEQRSQQGACSPGGFPWTVQRGVALYSYARLCVFKVGSGA